MASGRWKRTRAVDLEQRVKELEAQLAQARATNDRQTLRDLLGRAGVAYREEADRLIADAVTFVFADSGRLLHLVPPPP